MLHSVTSRPFATQCQTEWPRPGEDFIHDRGTFQKTTGVRSFYVVNPEWLSEEVNPPKTRGRARLPWPWEFPGARSTYGEPVERLRNRVLSDTAVANEKKRLGDHGAYQVKHNSPWYVNNSSLNPQSNSLYKRDPRQPHTLPHNNARRILNLELRHPPMEQRFRNGDLSKSLDSALFPDNRHLVRNYQPSVSQVEAADFRKMSNAYRTYCDWQ